MKSLKKIKEAQKLLLEIFNETQIDKEQQYIRDAVCGINLYLDQISCTREYSQLIRCEAHDLLREGQEVHK